MLGLLRPRRLEPLLLLLAGALEVTKSSKDALGLWRVNTAGDTGRPLPSSPIQGGVRRPEAPLLLFGDLDPRGDLDPLSGRGERVEWLLLPPPPPLLLVPPPPPLPPLPLLLRLLLLPLPVGSGG